ncbi:hypothetical protein AURDEDRAFT_127133 [Auricularia subglabra TFB-10046 SS5]|uniref:Uncharacterized protein n=1 Tax=Auricularia subglabra (strain TFB-10046 / SS5) TaxID=717982 RepID=J0D2U6_AURST|nr:hypothetical protein AURDEDRAFT_127133 [Auricularia subglabra TFB-10046 SS5]
MSSTFNNSYSGDALGAVEYSDSELDSWLHAYGRRPSLAPLSPAHILILFCSAHDCDDCRRGRQNTNEYLGKLKRGARRVFKHRAHLATEPKQEYDGMIWISFASQNAEGRWDRPQNAARVKAQGAKHGEPAKDARYPRGMALTMGIVDRATAVHAFANIEERKLTPYAFYSVTSNPRHPRRHVAELIESAVLACLASNDSVTASELYRLGSWRTVQRQVGRDETRVEPGLPAPRSLNEDEGSSAPAAPTLPAMDQPTAQLESGRLRATSAPSPPTPLHIHYSWPHMPTKHARAWCPTLCEEVVADHRADPARSQTQRASTWVTSSARVADAPHDQLSVNASATSVWPELCEETHTNAHTSKPRDARILDGAPSGFISVADVLALAAGAMGRTEQEAGPASPPRAHLGSSAAAAAPSPTSFRAAATSAAAEAFYEAQLATTVYDYASDADGDEAAYTEFDGEADDEKTDLEVDSDRDRPLFPASHFRAKQRRACNALLGRRVCGDGDDDAEMGAPSGVERYEEF